MDPNIKNFPREYHSWKNMKSRCFNPNNEKFSRYGERGITVCDRWRHSFGNFIKDMGPKPTGLTLERINNDGDYCRENCRWANHHDQAKNRSTAHRIEYDGMTKTITGWSKFLGISRGTLSWRVLKWGPALAFKHKFHAKFSGVANPIPKVRNMTWGFQKTK